MEVYGDAGKRRLACVFQSRRKVYA